MIDCLLLGEFMATSNKPNQTPDQSSALIPFTQMGIDVAAKLADNPDPVIVKEPDLDKTYNRAVLESMNPWNFLNPVTLKGISVIPLKVTETIKEGVKLASVQFVVTRIQTTEKKVKTTTNPSNLILKLSQPNSYRRDLSLVEGDQTDYKVIADKLNDTDLSKLQEKLISVLSEIPIPALMRTGISDAESLSVRVGIALAVAHKLDPENADHMPMIQHMIGRVRPYLQTDIRYSLLSVKELASLFKFPAVEELRELQDTTAKLKVMDKPAKPAKPETTETPESPDPNATFK